MHLSQISLAVAYGVYLWGLPIMPNRAVASSVMNHRPPPAADTRAWLLAGAFAITVNTLLLYLAAYFGL